MIQILSDFHINLKNVKKLVKNQTIRLKENEKKIFKLAKELGIGNNGILEKVC